MGAGEPANQATQWLAPALPVFAGMPAPTASARAFNVPTRQLRSQDPGPSPFYRQAPAKYYFRHLRSIPSLAPGNGGPQTDLTKTA
ncbi:hypothetical protein DMX12_15230 [Pseudomonas sp. MB-090624]|nr:hypothetical protein DMX12_15230 [Pseudomonas sp. MB-090624]